MEYNIETMRDTWLLSLAGRQFSPDTFWRALWKTLVGWPGAPKPNARITEVLR
jgi:hypothetical protein